MTETTPDNNAQQLLELQRARRTVRLMAQGMMPRYEIAKAADEAVRDAIGSDPEARKAFRASSKVLGYINMTRVFLPRMQARGSGVICN